MAFEKAYIFGIQQQNKYGNPPGLHIYAEIVLINLGNKDLRPTLFQLNKDSLSEEDLEYGLKNQRIMSIDDESFMMVGEVMTINRKTKMIVLSNENTVTYKHLIIAKDEEFGATINALIEALRVQKNLPKNILAWQQMLQSDKSFKYTSSKFSPKEKSKNLEKIVHPKISNSLKSRVGTFAIGSDKKLCELQIKT